MIAANLKDLDTKGFVVIPGFLSESEVQELRLDFEHQPLNAHNRNYSITRASDQATVRLRRRVEAVLPLVNSQTKLHVDSPQSTSYFATGEKRGIKFGWHQDHESFYMLQNSYDYLNFYIPIVKSRRDKSNLSLVPFDVLERESPRTFGKLVRHGATRFMRIGPMKVAICDDSGTLHIMPRCLDQMAYTPKLAAGDLLLLRGDVIHRTQDADTERVAASSRAGNSASVVKRRQLAAGGLHKAKMMANNPGVYERMFKAFDATQCDEMRIDELVSTMKGLQPKEWDRRRDFLRYLIVQKVRSGVLARFVWSACLMFALT